MFTSLFVMSYRVTCCGRFVLRARFCVQHLKGLFQMPNSRYVACADGQSGVELVWPEGDRTQCLMDMSSINAESTQVECLTLYKLLVHLESVKKVRGHSRHRLHFQLSRFIQGDAQGSDAVPVYGRHH